MLAAHGSRAESPATQTQWSPPRPRIGPLTSPRHRRPPQRACTVDNLHFRLRVPSLEAPGHKSPTPPPWHRGSMRDGRAAPARVPVPCVDSCRARPRIQADGAVAGGCRGWLPAFADGRRPIRVPALAISPPRLPSHSSPRIAPRARTEPSLHTQHRAGPPPVERRLPRCRGQTLALSRAARRSAPPVQIEHDRDPSRARLLARAGGCRPMHRDVDPRIQRSP